MSDWVYVAGEGGFNQDFRIIDQETNELIDMSGATNIKMFIQSTDLVNSFPVGGTTMSPATNSGESVARLVIQSNFMPQSADMYLCQISFELGGIFKTFIINLRVIRNLGA